MTTDGVKYGLFLALSLALTAQASPPGAEAIGPFAGSAPAAVSEALTPTGYRVTLGDGTMACEIWFRREIRALNPSIFVGVVSFSTARSDFRGQAIKAGSYTLRYAQMPSDGNHLGAAPTTDFLLLAPLAEDTDPAADYSFEKLTKLSARASGTNHPAPLNLAEVSGQSQFPAVVKNEYGHEVFFVKLKKAGGGDLPIGLVVKGRTDH
jgi:hypothetical protein